VIDAAVSAATLGAASAGPNSDASAPAVEPNILLILSDDMGFSDLGCYGGEIRTPNLDRLASEGARFTQFYNTARCCPTRACLLTGLYPHQAGIGHMTGNQGLDGYEGDLNSHCVTIAQVLKSAGYATYMAGKWHVTKFTSADGPKTGWPLQRGFDRYYGIVGGAASYWDPGTLTRDNSPISAFADPEYEPERYYFTDAIADNAIRYLDDHHRVKPAEPFFMYVAFTAAHWPLHAPEDEIAKYHGVYDHGYEPIRKARFERLRRTGILHDGWDMSPQAGDWDAVLDKTWEARCMEVYAAQVTRMDAGIGRIVNSLRANGQLENTLILFLQDNGGCAEEINREGRAKRQNAPSLPVIPNDAVRSEGRPKQTRDGYPVLGGKEVLAGPPDTFISYGRNWANVSNTPFREYKHFVHEGGISTPLIVHWPAGLKGNNRFIDQPSHLIDIMATCVEMSGAKYPSDWRGQPITPMEGRSLAPALMDKPMAPHSAIFWEHEGNRALRIGGWKLVAKAPTGKWELYNMERDRTELHDLAGMYPDRTSSMAAEWERWAKRTHALPWPWKPQYGEPIASGTPGVFPLKQGDIRRGPNAPHIVDRAITIEASVSGPGDGVIVAQGGLVIGYALYIQGGKPAAAIRQARQMYLAAGKESLPAGRALLRMTLASDGTLTLFVGDRTVATTKAAGLFASQPGDALCVGFDDHDPVGRYSAPFRFTGEIEKATVTVK
jgi:arylsulfatase